MPFMAARASASVLPTTSGMAICTAAPTCTLTAVPVLGTTAPASGDWLMIAPTRPGFVTGVVDLERLLLSPAQPWSCRAATASFGLLFFRFGITIRLLLDTVRVTGVPSCTREPAAGSI